MGKKGNSGQPNDQCLMPNTHRVAHMGWGRFTSIQESYAKHSVPLDVKGFPCREGTQCAKSKQQQNKKYKREKKTVNLLVKKIK